MNKIASNDGEYDGEPFQSKAFLRHLLNEDPEAQSRVAGISTLSEKERSFMLCSCSAQIIVHTICRVSGRDRRGAREGLASLIEAMEEQVEEICRR